MHITNDADSYIHDYKRYRYYFYVLTGRQLLYPEYYELYLLLTKPKIKKYVPCVEDIRFIRDLFDQIHEPLLGPPAYVDTIHRLEWAYYVKLITDDELEALKKFWRRTC